MTDRSTIRAVIRYLGLVALVLVLGDIVLMREILNASRGREAIDPAVVGLFASMTGLTGGAIGALGSMLVSTRSSDEPTPVTGAGGGPVEVAEVDNGPEGG